MARGKVMSLLNWIPLIAMIAMIVASLLRGRSVRRGSGITAWAFLKATGKARLAGILFVTSIGMVSYSSGIQAARQVAEQPSAIIAAIFSIAGVAMVIIAQLQMGAAWRIGFREGDAPVFVSHGLYRFSRNPIFLGMILLSIGTAIGVGYWWVWLAAALFALSAHLSVLLEEQHLSASFGAAYAAFKSKVPRWIGFGGLVL
jgi:protein-S-isoprenylcysteine O-methyltransferase Ste14